MSDHGVKAYSNAKSNHLKKLTIKASAKFLIVMCIIIARLSWAELALILKYPAFARPGLVIEKLHRKLIFGMHAHLSL